MKKRVFLCLMCVLGTLALYSCGVDPSSVSESTVSESSEAVGADVNSVEYINSALEEVKDEYKYVRTYEVDDGQIVVDLENDGDISSVKQYLKDRGVDVEKIHFTLMDKEPRVLT